MQPSDFHAAPSAQRIHIGFFGCRNAGKSSLVNAIAGQDVSIVSAVKGTTTDPVRKAMELLPLGAVLLLDTAGLDDPDTLGALRTEKTYEILRHTDVAVLVIDATVGMTEPDHRLLETLQQRQIPFVLAFNKCEGNLWKDTLPAHGIAVSAKTGFHIDALKEQICNVYQSSLPVQQTQPLLADLVSREQVVLLVTPIDAAAPKGRMILPQVQTIRAILDAFAICITVQPDTLPAALRLLRRPPDLVITDSQAFSQIHTVIPEEIPLTSFSILFARYKGVLQQAVEDVQALQSLRDHAHILIAEGCTHHRQCNDIGTVKLPDWIRTYTGKTLSFSFCSGNTFPADVSAFDLVVHCGGCMLNEREVQYRRQLARQQGVPFTNYGTLIAAVNGILDRSVGVFRCLR
jgi:[FeFe] hydrogenase H-cluster maturation GTPase HydF